MCESHFETWFVQCKQHKHGVGPEKLEGAFAWAAAERPDVLLIAVSNFLSNPAKTWTDDYIRQNRPAFRVKVWERKNLEGLVSAAPALVKKYELPIESAKMPFHPATGSTCGTRT